MSAGKGAGRSRLPPAITIVGPTAVGKTPTSIGLAQRFGGEIISVDSRQFYRGMDIGTAKATAEEQESVPHHLLDLCEPDATVTLAEFQELAYTRMAEIVARGRVPFLVGGTGLYMRAVVEGYGIPRVPPDPEVRDDLFAFAEREGHEALHARLAAVDPEAAVSIDARNVRRVVRALEVYYKSGTPITVLQRKSPPPYSFLQIGLTRERSVLYERVDQRIEQMLAQGLVEEVRGLLAAGVPATCESMSGLGYRETVDFLEGNIDTEAGLTEEIGRNTRRFIRTQYNWFRLNDPDIHWFDLDETPFETISAFVEGWLHTQARG